jgi:oligoribonuclease
MNNAAHKIMVKATEAEASSSPLVYLFTDLECTGLNPVDDEIVEFGVIGVDAELRTLFEFNTLIQPTARTIARIENTPPVLEMMEANGLINELRIALVQNDKPSLGDAVDTLIEAIDTYATGTKVTLSGSGVATYDFTFLKAQTPELAARLTYWCNDVGDSRRRWRAATGGDLVAIDATKNHRAFDDVTIHLAEARHYRNLFAAISARFGASDLESIISGLENR